MNRWSQKRGLITWKRFSLGFTSRWCVFPLLESSSVELKELIGSLTLTLLCPTVPSLLVCGWPLASLYIYDPVPFHRHSPFPLQPLLLLFKLAFQLAERAASLIPAPFRPSHFVPSVDRSLHPGCFLYLTFVLSLSNGQVILIPRSLNVYFNFSTPFLVLPTALSNSVSGSSCEPKKWCDLPFSLIPDSTMQLSDKACSL